VQIDMYPAHMKFTSLPSSLERYLLIVYNISMHYVWYLNIGGQHNSNLNYSRSRTFRVRDQNSAELLIAFVPADIYANKILETFKGMIQLC